MQNIQNKKSMRRLLIGLFSFFFSCLFFAGVIEALRLKTTWGERVDLSEKIIRGHVTAVRSYWNNKRTLIHTDVTIQVEEYIKGDGSKEITITIPGGAVGDTRQWVSDTPQFRVGDYSVIFLNSSGQVTGGPDGVFSLERKDSDKFLIWLRAYIAGDPTASKEGPPVTPRVQSK